MSPGFWEFDTRYKIAPEKRDGATARRETAAQIQALLARLRTVPGRPATLRYFEEIVGEGRRLEELRAATAPRVGVFCNLVPEELIRAAGAIPVRLCAGSQATIHAAEETLPRDICPLAKSSFGMAVCGLEPLSLCSAVVVPLCCDAKTKLAQTLNDYVPTWVIDLPGRRDYERDLADWRREVRELAARLGKLTGRPITRDSLREAVELYHARAEAFRALYNLRKAHPHLLSGRDTFLVTEASFSDEPGRWTDRVWALIRELEERARVSPTPPPGFLPVLLTGAPVIWPNWKLPNVIEEHGATVVADTLCSGTQRLFDPVQVDEPTEDGMLRALALRYFSASICPSFADSSDRIDRILELCADFKVRGVISHNLRLCTLFDMESARVRQVLRQKVVPMLAVQTDYGQEDVEQVKTRVEAFLEMLG
jgi:benzoyl-CoA reductase/2-hydroxyglutaryl-CoA dehydratase subunit BcrC/BadD/HgdB